MCTFPWTKSMMWNLRRSQNGRQVPMGIRFPWQVSEKVRVGSKCSFWCNLDRSGRPQAWTWDSWDNLWTVCSAIFWHTLSSLRNRDQQSHYWHVLWSSTKFAFLAPHLNFFESCKLVNSTCGLGCFLRPRWFESQRWRTGRQKTRSKIRINQRAHTAVDQQLTGNTVSQYMSIHVNISQSKIQTMKGLKLEEPWVWFKLAGTLAVSSPSLKTPAMALSAVTRRQTPRIRVEHRSFCFRPQVQTVQSRRLLAPLAAGEQS